LAAALTFSLFIGRLDSKLIRLPAWAVAALYFYAIIQVPSAVFFTPGGQWLYFLRLSMMTAALVLKFLLFVMVQSSLDKGALLYYMWGARAVDKQVVRERDAFISALSHPEESLSPDVS
jgi:hypothetical protein